MLTITHTHEAGTLIEGTSKGDGTAAILKANRWRWGRSIGTWYVPNSRDKRPDHLRIRATTVALEAAGYEVTHELDESIRTTAEVEAAKSRRQDARVEALNAKAARKAHKAAEAWSQHERHIARLPEGGEPIKIGHHSEARHRNAIDRAERSARRGLEAQREAEGAAAAAVAASVTTSARYNPVTVANRIEKIAADLRRVKRAIEAAVYDPERGYQPATDAQKMARRERYSSKLDELNDQLTYWQTVRAEQIENGTATSYGPDTISRGDYVKIRGHWWRVARTNPKTVSVETEYSWTNRSPYAEIQAHRKL